MKTSRPRRLRRAAIFAVSAASDAKKSDIIPEFPD